MTTQASSHHLLIVDPSVASYQQLLLEVADGFDIIFLRPDADGMHQITAALEAREGIQTLHILSHGAPGQLFLGNGCLNRHNFNRYSAALAQWSCALAPNAEIFLYGCNVAHTQEGQQFIHLLSELTGATVAASTTLTGAARLGGTWDLAYRTAPIRTPLAFSKAALAAYPAVLVAAVPNLLYGAISQGFATSQIYELDTENGVAQRVGELQDTRVGAPSINIVTFAIARVIDPVTREGRVYFIENGAGVRRVGYWNPSDGQTTVFASTIPAGVGEFIKMAQNQSGIIYAMNLAETTLYTVDPTNGTVTPVGPVPGLPLGSGDMAFDPESPNRLIISVQVGGQLQLFTVDVTDPTLTPTQLGGNLPLGGGIGSLAFGADGNLYASSTSGTVRRIFEINKNTGAITSGPINLLEAGADLPGDLNDFGSLPTVTDAVNLDVRIGNDLPNTVRAGQRITFSIRVTNSDPLLDVSGVSVLSNLPSELTNISWSGRITSGVGGFPGASSGTGSTLSNLVNLNAGAVVTYTVTATVVAGTPENTRISVSATALPPRGIDDRDLSNNTFVDTTLVIADPGGGGDDDGCVPGTPIIGNARNNRLIGADGVRDIIRGNGGNDTLLGLGCPDLLLGGQGRDLLDGGGARDTLDGGGGRDRLLGRSGNDVLRGGLANDTLIGSTGNDVLSGNSGVDRMDGGLGNDRLLGGGGNDTMTGGDGNDFLEGSTGFDTMNGDAGNDRIFGQEGNDSLRGGNGSDYVEGGDGNDRIFGDRGIDSLRGGNGNDVIVGGGNRDFLFGDAGDDRLLGGVGNDVLRGALGNDVMFGEVGNDVLSGNSGNDSLDGGVGNDRLLGGGGNDTLTGGDGNDLLRGSTGDDVIGGDGGNDRLLGEAGNDFLRGGAGGDVLDGGDGNDRLQGDEGQDNLNGGLGDDTLLGGLNEDDLFGDVGNDFLNGEDGNDALRGALGNDTLVGEAGNDLLSGNSGNDSLVGGLGDDRMLGGGEDDILIGAEGNDLLEGDSGNDDLNGGADNDRLLGQEGNDTLRGGAGNDELSGDQGNDTLRGNIGDDILRGTSGQDSLDGQEGNDLIVGGANADTLVGSIGADTFQFRAQADGGLFGDSLVNQIDRLLDFNQTEGDRFRLQFDTGATELPTALFNAGVIAANSIQVAAQSVFADRNGARAGRPALGARQAAFFTWQQQTFLAVNNAQPAYNASHDLLIEVTNIVLSPGDANRPVLNVNNYFV